MNKVWCTFAVLLLLPVIAGCPGSSAIDGSGDQVSAERPAVSVVALQTEATEIARTTTQPATVHAWFEAKLYAKAAGYIKDLRVDIGREVKEGEVLAVLAVPELEKQMLAKEATVIRLVAEERRAESLVAVAKASLASFQAKLERAKAEVVRTDATVTAASVELERVRDLVQQRAVAERLLDEAIKKHEAAVAEKSAVEAGVVSADAELQLTSAEADAANAEWDVAKATTEVARRELEEWGELLKYTEIRSPFAGIVSQRNVEPGTLVHNSQSGSSERALPLFVVTQTNKLRIRVEVPERDAPLAGEGDPVEFRFPALPDRQFAGTVSRTAGVLDEHTRTLMVEIDLDNPDGKLLPGMFGEATITLEPPAKRLVLPAAAVRYDETGNSYVYVVSPAGVIKVVPVKTGLDDGLQIEITSGLEGSERIVGPLLRRLKAGQKVIIES